jgi:hypothetical protein
VFFFGYKSAKDEPIYSKVDIIPSRPPKVRHEARIESEVLSF